MLTALDTETTLAGNREPIPRLVSVSFASDLGVLVIAAHDPRLRALITGALAGGLILANAPFDLFVLWRALGAELWPHIHAALKAGRVFDVLTREKLIDIAAGKHRKRGPYNLGAVSERRAGIKLNKADPWRRRYGALLGHEIMNWPAGALAYAQLDAWATWRVYCAQEAERARHRLDVFVDQSNHARAHFALYSYTIRGVHTDPERVAALDALLSARIAGLERRALAVSLAGRTGEHKTARVCADRKLGRPCSHGRVQRTKAAAQAALVEWCRAIGRTPVRNDLTEKARMRGETEGSIAMSKKALEHAGVPRGRWGDPERRPGENPHALYDKLTTPPAEGDPPWAAATKIAHPLEVYRELGGLRASYSKNIPVLRHPVIRTRYDELVSSGRTSASGFKRVQIEDSDEDEDEDEGGGASLADFDCELDEGDSWVGTNTQNFDRNAGYRECLVPPP